jgi:hypothetical protein
LKEYALGDQNKRLTIDVIRKTKIKIPITKEGKFDLKKQQDVTEKYQRIRELRSIIKMNKKEINELVVDIKENLKVSDQGITIGEIFDLSMSETNSSKFTKSFIDKHKGDIPVHSASKNENSVDYGHVQDNLPGIKYFENCLTWNIDGSIGKVFLRKGRFSLSEKVIPLIVKETYKNSVDLIYLKYTTEKELAKQDFDFSNKAGKEKIKNIEIKVPVIRQGKFDLIRQKEIAIKYQQIEEIKKRTIEELEKIEKIKVDISI